MIDEFDKKLMLELQKGGRETYIDLGRKLSVAEGTVRRRLRALLDNEVIRIVAELNVRKLGFNLVSFMGLQVKMTDLRTVSENLAKNPNICFLSFVTGRYDLMAVIVTRSPEDLSQFIAKEISAIPSILRTETFVNMEIIKGKFPSIDTSHLLNNSLDCNAVD